MGLVNTWPASRRYGRGTVTVMTNAKNVGFPAAINQGLRAAGREYLVLLNNDVVVTDGWLDQLVALTNARTDGTSPDLVCGCSGASPLTPPPEGGTRVDGSLGVRAQ